VSFSTEDDYTALALALAVRDYASPAPGPALLCLPVSNKWDRRLRFKAPSALVP
jgi:hypothetical protein